MSARPTARSRRGRIASAATQARAAPKIRSECCLLYRLRSAEDVAHEQADGVNKDANILGAVFLRRVEDLRNAEDKGRACVTDVSERARPPHPPPCPKRRASHRCSNSICGIPRARGVCHGDVSDRARPPVRTTHLADHALALVRDDLLVLELLQREGARAQKAGVRHAFESSCSLSRARRAP